MKRNPALRLGAIVLVLSVISISLATGTFAKYTTSYVGESETLRAAKFKFNLTDDADFPYVSGTTFNIFQYEDDGVYSGLDTYADFIAPGTSGSLPLNISNLSEVAVALKVDITETNVGGIPIYYTLDTDGTPGTIRYSQTLTGEYASGVSYQSFAALEGALSEDLAATDGLTPTTKNYDLNWHWAFETNSPDTTLYAAGKTNDEYDTAIGLDAVTAAEAAKPSVTLQVTATVEQLDTLTP